MAGSLLYDLPGSADKHDVVFKRGVHPRWFPGNYRDMCSGETMVRRKSDYGLTVHTATMAKRVVPDKRLQDMNANSTLSNASVDHIAADISITMEQSTCRNSAAALAPSPGMLRGGSDGLLSPLVVVYSSSSIVFPPPLAAPVPPYLLTCPDMLESRSNTFSLPYELTKFTKQVAQLTRC
ncbi:hypothetical protein CBL_11443 [Carabus blaptoides fortunei]